MKKSRIIHRVLLTLLIIFLSFVLIEVGRLLLLRHSINVYQKYWHNQAQSSAAPGDITYIALGDSAAQGIGASQPEKGYVGLLRTHLQSKTHKNVHIFNLSVTGATVQDLIETQLPQFKKIAITNETVITVEIGANNIRNYDHQAFNNQINQLFKQLPPQTVVADLPYFGGGRASKGEAAALDASAIIVNAARKYELRVAPLHQTTKEHDNLLDYAADFFHPSNRGYQNWFEAFWYILG